jgi:hypothetical protein
VSDGSGLERGREVFEADLRIGLLEGALGAAFAVREDEAGGVVESLADELLAEDFVASRVGRSAELLEDLEMRLSDADGSRGASALARIDPRLLV